MKAFNTIILNNNMKRNEEKMIQFNNVAYYHYMKAKTLEVFQRGYFI